MNVNLYEIVKSLQAASGSNAKQAILTAHKGNELLKAYMKAVMDPAINYYQKKLPKHGPPSGRQASFDMQDIEHATRTFAGRMVTGNVAIKAMQKWLEDQASVQDQELIGYIIDRSIGASVGDTMVLKTWPNLYFIPPYMRCSLMTPKIKKHFDSLDEIIVQKKADGSFLYLKNAPDGTATAFTRAGSHYPMWLSQKLLKGAPKASCAYLGELVVYKDGKLLDRATGNGICNSILKGGEEHEYGDYKFLMEAWDVLPTCDFEAGLCEIDYRTRFETLERHSINMDNLDVIETDFVKSLDEAYKIYSKYTAAGMEGAVIKDGSAPFRDHTSPYNVKLKIKFEAEYRCVGVYEGEGKAKGMLGGIAVETEDGLLECNCGSGFSDAQRKHFWNYPVEILTQVVTLEANDIVQDRDSRKKPSLFLPIFIEIRNDKTEADSYERVVAQLEAAKQGT